MQALLFLESLLILVIDDFVINDFSCSIADIVHTFYPHHLSFYFELLSYSFLFCKLIYQPKNISSACSSMSARDESLKTVPQSYREGAFGLGAGKWRTVRTVVLPDCIDGIVTGCILSVGRIIGESAALLFTAGFAHTLNGFFDGLRNSGATLTVSLYVYAKEQGEFGVAFAIAAILIAMTVLINLSASLVSRCFKKRRQI